MESNNINKNTNTNTNSINNQSEINIVLWAYEISKATEIALQFLNSPNTTKPKPNLFGLSEQSHKINIYLRSPKTITTSAPQGITSILILYLSDAALKHEKKIDSENEELLEAKNYFETRKKIPFKFLTFESSKNISSTTPSDEFINLYFPESKKAPLASLLQSSQKSLLLSDADFFNSLLLKVFSKFDLDNDNKISFEDLIKAAAELGQILASDDAKMIVNTLEDRINPGKISFEAFKRWWVHGRSDFLGFRRACKARLFLDDLLLKSRNNGLNNYFFENLKNEGKEICEEELSQLLDLTVHANKPFEDGIGLFVQFCNGAEALEIIETKFDELENSEFGLALKFKFESAQAAKSEAEKVEKFVNDVLSVLLGDKASLIFLLGLVLRFKTCENFVVVFFADKRPKADSMLTGFKALFSGTMHLFTELAFEDLLILPLEQVLEKLLNAKVRINAKMFDLKRMLGNLLKQIEIVKKSEFEENEKENVKEKIDVKSVNASESIIERKNVNLKNAINENHNNIINVYVISANKTTENNNYDNKEIKIKNKENQNSKSSFETNDYFQNFKKNYKTALNILKVYLMLRNIKLELSYDPKAVKDQFFQYISEISGKIEKEKGEDSFEIKYEHLQAQDAFFESPANLENFEEKFLGYYNLIEFFLTEIREFYKELIKDKELIRSFFDEESIRFLNKIDLNEIVLECHSRSIITPLFVKFILKVPKFKKVFEAVFKEEEK